MKSFHCAPYLKPLVLSVICVMLVVATALTGCQLSSIAGKNNTPAPNPEEIEGETNLNEDVKNDGEENGPEAPVILYNVLTGRETTSELAGLRPVAVCIDNTPYSLPQYGLSAAQMVIEAPLADGGTRLMLLTTDYRYVTTIGAVASTRSYLLELGAAFGAIQSFDGTDGTVSEEDLKLFTSLDNKDPNVAGLYYTDPTRFLENNLMTNGILLDAAIRGAEITATGNVKVPYVFAESGKTVSLDGGFATSVSVAYSEDLRVSFTYDGESGTYLRGQYGAPQLDGANGEQACFDNLFLLYTSSVTYDREDGRDLDLVLSDGGTGYYCTGGQRTQISWTMAEDGTLSFVDADGEALEVNRGTSYIGMVSAGAKDSVTIR